MRNAGGLLKESPAPPELFPNMIVIARNRRGCVVPGFFLSFLRCDMVGGGWFPVAKGGACLSPRLPTPPLVYFPAPYPPDPLPRWGRGGILGYFMQGASPLASPGAEPERRLQPLPIRCQAGGVPPALSARRALAVPGGGLPAWLPACPSFSFVFAPYPPDPLPRRGRGNFLFISPGASPPAPLH